MFCACWLMLHFFLIQSLIFCITLSRKLFHTLNIIHEDQCEGNLPCKDFINRGRLFVPFKHRLPNKENSYSYTDGKKWISLVLNHCQDQGKCETGEMKNKAFFIPYLTSLGNQRLKINLDNEINIKII